LIVIVAEENSPLRKRPVRTRPTSPVRSCISVASGFCEASMIAGATSPPPRCAIATPACTACACWNPSAPK
jgi:hypothetical protein